MADELLEDALRQTCEAVHDLLTDGCANSSIRDASSAQDAVVALLSGFKSNVPKSTALSMLTRLANKLYAKIAELNIEQDRSSTLAYDLNGSQLRVQSQQEEHDKLMAKAHSDIDGLRYQLGHVTSELDRTREDLADARASVRALRKQLG